MKKLCRKGAVHPTPPTRIIRDQQLAFLPAAILTLTAALPPEDKEVLAYLISCSYGISSVNRKTSQKATTSAAAATCVGDHTPSFNCDCFSCYTSYWARWDSSPNRQLIHEIIDAYEEGLMMQSKKKMKGKKDRRRRGCSTAGSNELKLTDTKKDELSDSGATEGTSSCCNTEEGEEGEFEKGSVRSFVSFLGERIWNAWT